MKPSLILKRALSLCCALVALGGSLHNAHASDWFLEISGASHTANDSIYADSVYFDSGDSKVDMIGGDIAFGFGSGATGDLMITLGGAYGDFDSTGTLSQGGNLSTATNDLTMGQIMIGYRYNYQLSSSLTLFIGAHIGVSSMSIDAPSFVVTSPSTGQLTSLDSNTADAIGFAYAFETGVTVNLSSNFYLFASYSLTSSDASPELKLRTGEVIPMEDQTYQTIRVGLGFSF